ncbi:hypothetical protein [Cysteiniphilum sp. QT6929]|uniref:hypothetical protein n=1 Tax=Cysteiniphilum sp. QT6929 TaxID=2975055 RepID=UPI0024B3B358|nr:hypothetical protein [Cysteiniphilum sp. QT6929]WHN66752.1 hypothetical protein NYP54_11755 [Cysteiniphilum sp. QT6929]
MEAVNNQTNQSYFNSIQAECDRILYTPKSKFHVDFLWLSQWLKHLHCPRQAILLLQVLYFSHKDGSVFTNAIGETYQGMLVNFNALEERLGFSRKVSLTTFKKLEEQGLIVRITLKNNRILYQSTSKANALLNDLHNYSLAANITQKDYDKLSQNFDEISLSAPSYAQRDRQSFTFGHSSIYRVNNQRVNRKNNTLNNQYQELKSFGASENFDCDKTVIFSDFCDFDFYEFGLGAVKCESSLFDYFTVNQAKVINTIIHVNANKIDIVAFNNALARKDIKREAQDFKQFVDWCYLVAVDAKGANVAKGSMTVSDCDLPERAVDCDRVNLGKMDTKSNNGNNDDNNNNQTNRQSNLDLDAVINELKAILTNKSLETITSKVFELDNQYDIDTENELVAAVLCDFGVISEDEFLSGFNAASDCARNINKMIQSPTTLTTRINNTEVFDVAKADNASNKAFNQDSNNANGQNRKNSKNSQCSQKNTGIDRDKEISGVASGGQDAMLKPSPATRRSNNTNGFNAVAPDNANKGLIDQARHNEKGKKNIDEYLAVVASDADRGHTKSSLTTEDDNNPKGITVKGDHANNEEIDQASHSVNGAIVVDGLGVRKGESVGFSNGEIVGFSGDGQGRYLRETVTNDNNYQQNINADNALKDNETIVDQFLNLGESKYKDFIKLCVERCFPSESEVVKSATRAIKDYGKLNFDQLYNGICYSHFTVPKLIDRQAVADIDQDNKKNQSYNKAKNPLSKNPNLKLPTLTDLKMPIIEKEVLYKDWASLAEQSLGLGVVSECQKIAIVAIIDYVKRKGVVITSDQEVYEWLYHTAANYEYYFSGATNFKHLANILIKRLVNQSFNRPSGFDHWRKMIGGSSSVDRVKIDNKTNNNNLKDDTNEIDLLLRRMEDKINITNPKKEVKNCHEKLYFTRYTGGFVV